MSLKYQEIASGSCQNPQLTSEADRVEKTAKKIRKKAKAIKSD